MIRFAVRITFLTAVGAVAGGVALRPSAPIVVTAWPGRLPRSGCVTPPLETPTGRYLGMVGIQRLLRDQPRVMGLAVPGMPAGSPGMEMGNRAERYDVLQQTSTAREGIHPRELA